MEFKELISDRRLFTTADGLRVVDQTDPDAAFLLAPEGGVISAGDAKKYGLRLVDGKVVAGGKTAETPTPAETGKEEAKTGNSEDGPDLVVPFVKGATLRNLEAAGFGSLALIAEADDDALLAIEGVDDKVLVKLRKAATP